MKILELPGVPGHDVGGSVCRGTRVPEGTLGWGARALLRPVPMFIYY